MGKALVWIYPNYFGSLCINPNKIQTNDMVGGVMYFCQYLRSQKHFGQGALGVFGVKHQFLLEKVEKGPNGPEMVPNES